MATGMGKEQLVNHLVDEHKISPTEAKRMVDFVIGGIEHGLVTYGKVTIPGHGTYETRKRSERNGRNPQTGETIRIAAKVGAAFKPGAPLSKKLNA